MTKNEIESSNELGDLLLRFPEPVWMLNLPEAAPQQDSSRNTASKRESFSWPRNRMRRNILLVACGAAGLALPMSFAAKSSSLARYAETQVRSISPGLPMILQSSLLSEREPTHPRALDKTCEIALKDLVQTTSTLRDDLELRRSIGAPVARSASSIALQKLRPRNKPPYSPPADPKPLVQDVLAAPPSPSVMENLVALLTPRPM